MAKGGFTFNFGWDEAFIKTLMDTMVYMEDIDKSKVILKTLQRGAGLITRRGKANLQMSGNQKTGNLKRSIRRKLVKKTLSAYAGFKKGKGGGNHAHLVDRGTVKRWTRKGYYRGSVSKDNPKNGNLFWTEAVESKGQQAMDQTLYVIYKELEKKFNKLNSRFINSIKNFKK